MPGLSGINGFFCINKPAGWTSADVVAVLRGALCKATGEKVKVGHMGTLDPMASGVLVVAAGKATRLFDILTDKKKGYVCSMKFGAETDTLDAEGTEVAQTGALPRVDELISAMRGFIGDIYQLPPAFSAKSVNGVKAYKLARAGREVTLKEALVHIYAIKLLKVNGSEKFLPQDEAREIDFCVDCGSGTYIRSLCRDIARKCNSLGTMTALERIYSGNFRLEHAADIDSVRANALDFLIPLKKALEGMFPVVELGRDLRKKFTNGVAVPTQAEGDVLVTIEGKEYALARCAEGKMKAYINLWV